ncbi:paralemmin 1b isoform X2 [Ictalurus furcatus]|uniref:paralemmin 1b isoform X2 n=2 Tax=Ictalurus furcatus TaxID=66913 RepID=UPI00235057E1|nr:paralemmin 1b isoform X2 [Ictalurus furcatus]
MFVLFFLCRMSEAVTQQERLQAIAEKRKKQAEIENKRRQLEDERRQLQHLKSKALRERWLLDGAPSSGENEFQRQLQEDEAKTRELEQSIPRLEQEIEELETGVPVSKSTADKQNLINTTDGPGKVENGVPKTRQVTGIEAKLECTNLDAKAIENASADHPVTMVFMGYKNVENEDETKKVLGIEDAVKAELVVIEDSENKAVTEDGKNDEKAPLNGAPSSPDDKKQDEATNGDEAKQGEAKKEKQRCKCCTVM